MSNFDDVTIFGNTSLADLFKQIHRNNKDVDKQINELIDTLKPIATSNAGSAVMLMPTVKDLIDVNVKNNDQLIKMAGIAQRAATMSTTQDAGFIDMDEINALIEEQNAIKEQGNKLLEQVPPIPQIEQK
jgi:cell division FtsZ-interacting protein ZapD